MNDASSETMQLRAWRNFDSIPQARGEAVSMRQLAASGEYSLETLRADIAEDSDFRKDVLKHFDALVREGKVDELVTQARKRSANLAAITHARQALRRRTRIKKQIIVGIKPRRKRFSESQCRRIQRLAAEGFNRTTISARFRVSSATITRVINEGT